MSSYGVHSFGFWCLCRAPCLVIFLVFFLFCMLRLKDKTQYKYYKITIPLRNISVTSHASHSKHPVTRRRRNPCPNWSKASSDLEGTRPPFLSIFMKSALDPSETRRSETRSWWTPAYFWSHMWVEWENKFCFFSAKPNYPQMKKSRSTLKRWNLDVQVPVSPTVLRTRRAARGCFSGHIQAQKDNSR